MTASTTGISIVYLTHRRSPQFRWFADGLARQIGDDEVELVLVDGLHSPARAERFTADVGGRFAFRHVPAKPSPYSGAQRRTVDDCFAAASARNTGVVYARCPYVVFVDDLSVPMPGWWSRVRQAANDGYVVAGAYQKHLEMRVRDGQLLHSRAHAGGIDTRWPDGDDRRPVRVVGGRLFGCSFGAPRDALLEVNGSDEICDPIGGEDWHLGVRLEWSGREIFYDRAMVTIESEELHSGPGPRRILRHATPHAYLLRLREFGLEQRAVPGAWESSYMLCDLVFGLRTTQTLGNYYLLSTLIADDLDALPSRFPQRYWFDGEPLASL